MQFAVKVEQIVNVKLDDTAAIHGQESIRILLLGRKGWDHSGTSQSWASVRKWRREKVVFLGMCINISRLERYSQLASLASKEACDRAYLTGGQELVLTKLQEKMKN